ncbi:MAG: hypothetical protein ACQKBY_11950 [Verrucomicrobiales bacterium]
MGHFVTSKDIPSGGEHLDASKLTKWKTITGGTAVVGFVASIAFLFLSDGTEQGSYAFSWLFALFYFLTLTFGGVFWTLLHNLSNSGWGTSVRRLMENLGFVVPFMAVFALPLLIPDVQKYLWEWMTSLQAAMEHAPEGASAKEALMNSADPHDHLLANKVFYLNPTMWHLRFVLYFAVIGFYIWKLRKLSVDQDTDPNPGTARLFSARAWSATGMFLFAVGFSFLAIDWIKALNFAWFSTMWGVYCFAGTALSSMALLIITALLLQKAGYLKKVVTQEHYHIMGKLTLAFTIFWAYVSFSQYFLYWYANVPEETMYFILRNTGNWNLVSLILVFGHFGLPFLLLLRSDVKKKPGFMMVMCLYILVIHALDVYHMVIPERGPSVGNVVNHHPELWIGGVVSFLGDLLAFVIIGCGFAFLYLRNLTSVALYPNRDPRILESANVSN